jgi:hypothetical protein
MILQTATRNIMVRECFCFKNARMYSNLPYRDPDSKRHGGLDLVEGKSFRPEVLQGNSIFTIKGELNENR